MADEKADFGALAREWAEAVSTDWSGLFDVPVSVAEPEVRTGGRAELIPRSGELVRCKCSVRDDESDDLWFAMPLRAAQVLAAAASKTAASDFESLTSRGFEDEVASPFREAMDLGAGILGRVFDEEASLPSVQLEDCAAADASEGSAGPPAGGFLHARFPLTVEGFPDESLELFVPESRAAAWFGVSIQASAGAAVAGEPLSVALLDADEESREGFGRLADELGMQLVVIDPDELQGEGFEELAEVSWIVCAFELGGRSGMDVLERVRSDPRTSAKHFALAVEAPTRALLDAALRWGATTLLYQPWEIEELRSRLVSS